MAVPQGFILGPYLCLLHINELSFNVKKSCDIVLLADDTVIGEEEKKFI